MRKNTLGFFVFCGFILIGISACEGDQGPLGPIGPIGPIGPMGENGAQNCMDCHGNSQLITAKLFQWEHSVHATGGHFTRNTFVCANCHTSQGFLQRVAEGDWIFEGDPVEDPLPPNCYTCHRIHTTYTQADWEFTQASPVTLLVEGVTLDYGKGNQCLNCHQSREYTPALPDPATGGTVNITSSRYGPHHGPQGTILAGVGGYEIAGSMPYENSAHTDVLRNNVFNGCIACHMGPAQGVDAGGHTFRVISEGGSLNTAACATCHENRNELLALVDDRHAEYDSLFLELQARLLARGLLNASNPEQNTTGTYEGHEAGVMFNYKLCLEEKSRGIHNFKYAKALMVNSIEALK